MTVLALACAKGGVGKTSAAVNLSATLAHRGLRVLLIDADPQAHATRWVLATVPEGGGTAEALLGVGTTVTPAPALWGDLHVMHGGPRIAVAEATLASEVGGEALLRDSLRATATRAAYDVAIIDTAPSTGLSTVAALVAADAVLVPVLPGYLALHGLAQIQSLIARVQTRLGAAVTLGGVLLTQTDERHSVTDEVRQMLRRDLGDRLYATEIRVSAPAKADPAHHRPGSDARSRRDYVALWHELMLRGLIPERSKHTEYRELSEEQQSRVLAEAGDLIRQGLLQPRKER